MAAIIEIILILSLMSSSCEVHCKNLQQSEFDRRHPFLDHNDNNVSFIRILRQVIIDHECPEGHTRDSNGDCVNEEKYREEKETLDLLTTTTPVTRKVTDDSTITKTETADTVATDTVATDTNTTYKINTVVTNTVATETIATIGVTTNKLTVATNTVAANTGTTETIATNTVVAKTVATDGVATNTDLTIAINHVVVHTVTTNVGKINTIVTTSIMSDTGITETDTTTPVSGISTEAEDHNQSQDTDITQIRKTGEDKTDSSSGDHGNGILGWMAAIVALLIIICVIAGVSWLMKILYNRYVSRQADEEDTISEVSFTTLRESNESSPFMFRNQ